MCVWCVYGEHPVIYTVLCTVYCVTLSSILLSFLLHIHLHFASRQGHRRGDTATYPNIGYTILGGRGGGGAIEGALAAANTEEPVLWVQGRVRGVQVREEYLK